MTYNKKIITVLTIMAIVFGTFVSIPAIHVNAATTLVKSEASPAYNTGSSNRYFYAYLYYSKGTESETSVTYNVRTNVHVTGDYGVDATYSGTQKVTGKANKTGTGKTTYNSVKGKGITDAVIVSTKSYTFERKEEDYYVVFSGTVKATSDMPSAWKGKSVTAKTSAKAIKIPALSSYTVSYDSNGGTGAPETQTKYYGKDITLSDTKPTMDGYIFAGWNTKADGSGKGYSAGGTYTQNESVELYAIWVSSAKVSFNANGGSLASDHGNGISLDQSGNILKDGEVLSVTMPSSFLRLDDTGGVNLVKKGYHIENGIEWCDQQDGNGSVYNQTDTYSVDTYPAGEKVYANWKANTYKIAFHPGADDVEGAMPDQDMIYDVTDYIESCSFIRLGYKLAGWSYTSEGDPEISDRGQVKNLTEVNNGTVHLYAIWRPIEETQSEIYVGKTVSGNATVDNYTFRITPVKGWTHENNGIAAQGSSGKEVAAEEIPMPEGSIEDETGKYKDVIVTGLKGNTGVLRTQSAGLITFEDPGWYMYKITELDEKEPGVKYDKTCYYVVVYVEYSSDEEYKVKVCNTTAWHNSRGSSGNIPDLEDISEITDNNGTDASENTEGVYGKTGSGTNSVIVRFWNEEDSQAQETAELYIMKSVKGSLGDLTKQFEFTAELNGLGTDTTYTINNDGAELTGDYRENSFRTDSTGSATISFKMSDDEGLGITDLPAGATFKITEAQSDHVPSYTITVDDVVEKTDSGSISGEFASALSTGTVTMTDPECYTVKFINEREITTNTGVSISDMDLTEAGGILLIFIIAGSLYLWRKNRI